MSEDKIKSEATDWLKTVDETLVALRKGRFEREEVRPLSEEGAYLAQAISALLAECREIKADVATLKGKIK